MVINKNLLRIGTGILSLGILILPNIGYSQGAFKDIDTLLEDNKVEETASRYSSVLLSFFPERADRLGFSSADFLLNDRSEFRHTAALSALRSLQENLKAITPSKLSDGKQTDLILLESSIHDNIWTLAQNRLAEDPLYYTEAFDAIYDILLKKNASPIRLQKALYSRIKALPDVAKQAHKNLTQPAPYLCELAMERAYYAYLSFDEITDLLLQGVEDDISISQTKQDAQQAKRAVKQMFDLFKKLAQEKNGPDFRLGTERYQQLLKNRYQIEENLSKLEKQLEKNFNSAKQNLSEALNPFIWETAEEEVTVVDGLNDLPTIEPLEKKKGKGNRKKNQKEIARPAQDFYKIASRIESVPSSGNLLNSISEDAEDLLSYFEQDGTLSTGSIHFSVKQLPSFYAYTTAHLFVPPYGDQGTASADLFLRLPSGNKLARKEQLNRDFNMPVRKLLLSGELVPGRYYQTAAASGLSSIRRLYPSITTAHGWSAYSQRLAKERGYINTKEDILFLAWAEYLRAAASLADLRLHTKQYSYTNAIDFLVAENGFKQEEAERILKGIASQPGEAVSYIYGLQTIEKIRKKYAKKQGKKFSLADFHNLLLQAGNIPPSELEKEIYHLQKQ